MPEGDPEGLPHLGGVGGHAVHRLPVHPGQNGVHDKVGPVGDKVQPPQDLNAFWGNPQLLPGLPQGALLRGLGALHLPAGETHLPRLAAEAPRPHLIEKGGPLLPLHQGDQDGIFSGGVHQAGGPGPEVLFQSCPIHRYSTTLIISRE